MFHTRNLHFAFECWPAEPLPFAKGPWPLESPTFIWRWGARWDEVHFMLGDSMGPAYSRWPWVQTQLNIHIYIYLISARGCSLIYCCHFWDDYHDITQFWMVIGGTRFWTTIRSFCVSLSQTLAAWSPFISAAPVWGADSLGKLEGFHSLPLVSRWSIRACTRGCVEVGTIAQIEGLVRCERKWWNYSGWWCLIVITTACNLRRLSCSCQ